MSRSPSHPCRLTGNGQVELFTLSVLVFCVCEYLGFFFFLSFNSGWIFFLTAAYIVCLNPEILLFTQDLKVPFALFCA